MAEKTAYDFDLTALDGQPMPLRQFAGRPLLIVNGASECGFTPQYAGLQALWREFKGTGLIVLVVPSNDFGSQEPGDAAAIATFCREKFNVDFPMAAKRPVRGADADPLFQWLSAKGGFLARPRWNFYKYLIGRDGRLIDWFASTTRPESAKLRRVLQRIVKS
jgi:glutathione peroxidase